MDMKIVRVVMDAVGVSDRVTRMKLLLKVPHRVPQSIEQNGIGIESCGYEFVVKRRRHREDKAVLDHRVF